VSSLGTLKVDGKVVSTQTTERTVPLTLQWDETFDIRSDTGTPMDDKDYKVPFKFTGKINKLTIAIDRPKLTPEDEKHSRKPARRRPTLSGGDWRSRSATALTDLYVHAPSQV
jgi:hypothetical protein